MIEGRRGGGERLLFLVVSDKKIKHQLSDEAVSGREGKEGREGRKGRLAST